MKSLLVGGTGLTASLLTSGIDVSTVVEVIVQIVIAVGTLISLFKRKGVNNGTV